MARSGIYKSEVKQARDTLVRHGKHPSIDAIRAELGNTGSKTTIHRYLKELEEEGSPTLSNPQLVSEAIQELVNRLALRLHEEAEQRISQISQQAAQQIASIEQTQAEQQALLAAQSQQLTDLDSELLAARQHNQHITQAVQAAEIQQAIQLEQLAGLKERLSERETYCQSLEQKHQHARDALEHFRQAAKEQRDNEQRRFEHQAQQWQLELRTLNQSLIVKQQELTQLYQEQARNSAELATAHKALRKSEQQLAQHAQLNEQLKQQLAQQETALASVKQQLGSLHQHRDELMQLLRDQTLARSNGLQDTALMHDSMTLALFPEEGAG